jgi:hypothetical protein
MTQALGSLLVLLGLVGLGVLEWFGLVPEALDALLWGPADGDEKPKATGPGLDDEP